MKLKIKQSLLLIILSIVLFSCQKEYSLEATATGSAAVYSFIGAPANCTNAVVAGIYQAAAPLGSSNIVTLSVDVTTAGSYTITTSTSNGVSFTGTGNFTTTGAQTVSLAGSGTPGSDGTFSFSPGTNACSFSIPFFPAAGSGTSVFSYTGAPGNCTGASAAGVYTSGKALTASNTVAISVNVTTLGTYFVTTGLVNGFSFSASGTFTVLGIQTITLTASGTPVIAGAFEFTPTGNGCSFSVTVIAGVVATDYIKCTIGGVARTFNDNLSGIQPDPTIISISGEEPTTLDPASFSIVLTKSPAITTGTYNRPSPANTSTFCLSVYIEGITPTAWQNGVLPGAGSFSVVVTKLTPTRVEGTFSGTIYSDPVLNTGAKNVTLGSFSVPL